MIVAGIDPGKTGALFIGAPVLLFFDVPFIKTKVAGKKNIQEVPDYGQWFDKWVAAMSEADHIFVENVTGSVMGHKREGKPQGNMFSFGFNVGFVRAIVIASRRPFSLITSQVWKREIGIKAGAQKDESRRYASDLLPGSRECFVLKKHVGRAEAALIGIAGRRKLLRGQ